MRYAIWNNKGGVGKSFLTFILASEYAAQYPDETVFVVDMCPQANVSEIILGGNGEGTKVLANLLAKVDRKTIGGYFDSRIAQPHVITGNETGFGVRPSDYNHKIPANLFLVVGDPSLEVQAEAINQIANQSLPHRTARLRSWRTTTVRRGHVRFEIEARAYQPAEYWDCDIEQEYPVQPKSISGIWRNVQRNSGTHRGSVKRRTASKRE